MRYLFALAIMFGMAEIAQAGAYGDDLTKCLARNTSDPDRAVLVRWMVTAMAAHPDVADDFMIDDSVRARVSPDMADLMHRLLLEDCKNEAQLAIRYEGEESFKSAFNALGQIAARLIFSDPKVAEELARIIHRTGLVSVVT